jgi:hypothetical protein
LVLLIFFGAWAVSADVDNQRSLAFGLPGTTPSLTGQNLAEQGPYQVARLGDSDIDSASAAGDSWWGKALLKACPLH